MKIAGIVLAGALLAGPAHAEGDAAPYAHGGYVPDFVRIIAHYNASGEPFRIAGVCRSACTMFLGIRNACVERNATLLFHAGHDIRANVTGPNTRATRAMLKEYNDKLRTDLVAGHHMDTGNLYPMSGADLIDHYGYRECPPR